jgi:hypothetical protein
MKRLILLSVVLAVGFAAAGWRGRFDEQFAAASLPSGPLPAGWTECEYLENPGTTAFINTGIVLTSNSTIVVESAILTGSGASTSMGYYDAAYATLNVGGITAHSLRMVGEASAAVNVGYDNRFTAVFDPYNGVFGINGFNTAFTPEGKTFPAKVFHIFNRAYARTNPKTRVYSFVAKTNNVEVQNLIPALDNNSVPCMFDTVTQAAFYNAGAGVFLYQIKEH